MKGFMKFSLVIVVALLMLAAPVMASTLQWGASPEGGGVPDGYIVRFYDAAAADKVYAYPAGGTLEVLDIERTLHLVPAHTYKFTVVAYNAAGESPPNDEILWVYEWKPYTPPDAVLPEEHEYILIPLPPGSQPRIFP